MPDVSAVARDLLERGVVEAVVGYAEAGPRRTRPFTARTPEEADKLVFNRYSLNNLAVYLTRGRRPVAGKIGLVVKGCDSRAVVMLLQEQQIDRDSVHLIGVECGGVAAEMDVPWSEDACAVKCAVCKVRTPVLFDTLAGGTEQAAASGAGALERMKELQSMTAEQRFAFWNAEFERCLRCYACRQVCPMCYCEQCVAEKNMPQWIDSSPTPRGNLAWNLIRAFHLGGRCIGCNECERACPVGIPLSLLNRRLGMTALEEFSYAAGMDPASPTLVGSYDVADREEYIK